MEHITINPTNTIEALSNIMAFEHNRDNKLEGEHLIDESALIQSAPNVVPQEDCEKAQMLSNEYPHMDIHVLCYILEIAEYIKRD